MITATYSPDDNKMRLHSSARLDPETYARVRAAGFRWAPQQNVFVAPMWTPDRADLCVELAGSIDDEDTSLTDRAEERAERFEDYRDRRTADAEQAHAAVAAIADHIPLGQPILVGHHSERHARRDAERIENGMRRAIHMWDTAQYWKDRARAAIRHAKYKERPDVRARRIKTIEADKRRQERTRDTARAWIALWGKLDDPHKDGRPCDDELRRQRAQWITNRLHGNFRSEHTHASGYVGPLSYYDALGFGREAACATIEEVREKAIRDSENVITWAQRWIDHYDLRLEYERAMLAEAGGTVAQRTGPEAGGACRCWAGPRGGWAYIQKVNRVSITLLDNWGNGGGNFTRTITFDKLHDVMTRADVEAARAAGRLIETDDKTGFLLAPEPTPDPEPPTTPEDTVCPDGPACPDSTCQQLRAEAGITPADVAAMRDTLRAGITVQAVEQLFPTPRDLAQQAVDLAEIQPGDRVLEPSAGTGALLGAMGGRMFSHAPEAGAVVAVEINHQLAARLRAEFPLTVVYAADFLTWQPEAPFQKIVMNPPFKDASDIKHIEHARSMLTPGGRLVAICANGPRQREHLKPSATTWIDLPPDTFKDCGTSVRAALIVIDAEPLPLPTGKRTGDYQLPLYG